MYPIQHSGAPIIAMTGTGPRGYPRPSALLIVNRLAGPLAREPRGAPGRSSRSAAGVYSSLAEDRLTAQSRLTA